MPGARTVVPLRRVPRWERVALVVALLPPVAFIVTTIPGVRPGGYDLLLDGVLNNLAYAMAPVVCLLRARRINGPRQVSYLLATALGLYGAGNVVWTFRVRTLEVEPFPSSADALWLSFYPVAFAALVVLVRRCDHRAAYLWLDGLVASLAVGAVAAAAVIAPIVQGSGSSWAAQATTTAYPLLDLVLLLVTGVTLSVFRWRPPVGLWFLAAGLVLFVAADVSYLFATALGTYRSGELTDGVWVLATVLMATTPGWPQRPAGLRLPSWALLAIPVVATATALGLLVTDHSLPLHPVAVALAAATIVVALGRLVAAFREVASLAHSRELALTDELTGLGNRRALYQLASLPAAAREGGAQVALLLVDLDRFKEVNDSHGHHAGDVLLTEIGARFQALVPARADIAVRLGGDEFAFLLTRADPDSARTLAEDIRDLTARPITIEGTAVRTDSSVGIAILPADEADLSALLRRADVAMYHAKTHHLGAFAYRADLDVFVSGDRLEILEQLRTAITERTLLLHYQPKVSTQGTRVTDVEALLRWPHPTRGLLTPDAFLPLAEEAGLMDDLTTAVLEQALDQAAAWHRAGRRLAVAVNLSASSLADVQLPVRIAAMLEARALPAQALAVEITEDLLMGDRSRAREILSGLRARGVRVAVDDYGTGYSSLTYLKDLPIDELKLDRSFVTDMTGDPRALAIVRSTIVLAHSLGLQMVAEGVEDAETSLDLAAAGCDVQQGWYWARALPAADLEHWLDASATPRPGPRRSAGPVPEVAWTRPA